MQDTTSTATQERDGRKGGRPRASQAEAANDATPGITRARRTRRVAAPMLLSTLVACGSAPRSPAPVASPAPQLHYVVQLCRAATDRGDRPSLDSVTLESVASTSMKPVARTQAGQTVYEERAVPWGDARYFVVKPSRVEPAVVWQLDRLPPPEPHRWTPWLPPTASSDEPLLTIKLMRQRTALAATPASSSELRLRYRLLLTSEHDEFQRQRKRLSGMRAVEAPACT